jgi:hypothetical protein
MPAKATPKSQRPVRNAVPISGSKERRGYVVDIIVSALSNYGRCYGRLRLPGAHSQIYANYFYGGFVADVDHS